MLSALLPLARFAPSVIGTVAEFFIPGTGRVAEELAERGKNWISDQHAEAEKAGILKALKITEDKLNTFDRMFIALGRDCGQLLDRVAELEAQGQDSTEELTRAVLQNPELQSQFDTIGREFARLENRIDGLEGDVRRLEEQYASVGAFAAELKQKQLSDTELADFREFRKAKQFQLAGNYNESEPILLKLANTQPKSAAVAVALAVAKHDDPEGLQAEVKRAQRLRPDDAKLQALASAATVAVTSRKTPASRPITAVIRLPKVGDTLDGWHLEARLGGGGWGIVFRATKRGQTRAVKVMRPDLADNSEFVETFTDEVFKLLRVRHLNLIAVERNGFCTAFMCHYFVMPLLDGLNLEQHLDRHGKPTDDVAMGWLTGLLNGLEHAHTNGLIHRDIKPANVMILPNGNPVLIDFGIAGLDGVAGYTKALGVSRLFAPPEQQSLGQADIRSDLYSLAATIFYALRHDHPLHERLAHEYEAELVAEKFRKIFDAALSVKRSKRPANVAAMQELLKVSAAECSKRERKEIEEAEERRKAEVEEQQRKVELERLAAEARKLLERKAGDQHEITLPGGVKMQFAWCPPGTFQMGGTEADDEKPVHEVRLTKGFYAAIHPVTVGQFAAFLTATKYMTEAETDGGGYWYTNGWFTKDASCTWQKPGFEQTDTHPVVVVSHNDAAAYAKWVGSVTGQSVRLLTEAEWEYAARGGSSTQFYWGDQLNGTQANCDGSNPDITSVKGPYLQKTTAVGTYAPNYPHPWRLTDMIGNVWEWCSDWYDEDYYTKSPGEDPTGPESGSGRVVRGGSWSYLAYDCRSACRLTYPPDYRGSNLGFRVVLDPPGQ